MSEAESLMAEENEHRSSRIELSTFRLVALLFAMGIGFGLLGFGLSTLGRTVIGGDVGEWAGMVVAFGILCGVCWTIARTMSHQYLGVVCAVWVCMGASKVGEEIGKDIGGEFAPKWGSSIAFVVVFVILFSLGNALKNRNDSSSVS